MLPANPSVYSIDKSAPKKASENLAGEIPGELLGSVDESNDEESEQDLLGQVDEGNDPQGLNCAGPGRLAYWWIEFPLFDQRNHPFMKDWSIDVLLSTSVPLDLDHSSEYYQWRWDELNPARQSPADIWPEIGAGR